MLVEWIMCRYTVGYNTLFRSRYVKISRLYQIYKVYVKLTRECQGIKGMSRYQGYMYVKISRICQDIKGMSRYQGFVKITRECQINKGMSS